MTDDLAETAKRARTYTITELCREFELTTRTLRFYEHRKLLSPARRGWTRIFSRRDRARLQLVLRGKRFGFTLTEIKKILDLYDRDNGRMKQLQVALPMLHAQLEVLNEERNVLSETIAELEASCAQLNRMLREHLKAGAVTGQDQKATEG